MSLVGRAGDWILQKLKLKRKEDKKSTYAEEQASLKKAFDFELEDTFNMDEKISLKKPFSKPNIFKDRPNFKYRAERNVEVDYWGTPQYNKPPIENIKSDGVDPFIRPNFSGFQIFRDMMFNKTKRIGLVLPWNYWKYFLNFGDFIEDYKTYKEKMNLQNDKKKKKELRTWWGRLNFLFTFGNRCPLQIAHLIHMKFC